MELKVLENREGKLRAEVVGENHTLLNLVTEYAWLEKARQASYSISHPYLSQPVLTIFSANPKKTLSGACQLIMNDAKEFQDHFKKAAKM